MPNTPRQARVWIGTVPHDQWKQHADEYESTAHPLAYIRGQIEIGETGYAHCQTVAHFQEKQSLPAVKRFFHATGHWEPTRSAAADDYVWKDATAVEGSRFEWGTRPVRLNNKKDWDAIWQHAIAGRFESIPASVRVGSYRTLKAIASDHMVPVPVERTCTVFWGKTGTGKSRDAWAAAGIQAYPKDPRSKFWCGYRDQQHVVLDEFRGGIDIGHILRWLDRYPVIVEVKGGAVCLVATTIWITSNIHPRLWYPDLDLETTAALLRRLNVTEYTSLT